jgi:hypothetical protein
LNVLLPNMFICIFNTSIVVEVHTARRLSISDPLKVSNKRWKSETVSESFWWMKKEFLKEIFHLKLISLISEGWKNFFFEKFRFFEAQKLSHHFTFFDGNFWRTKKILFINIEKSGSLIVHSTMFWVLSAFLFPSIHAIENFLS